MEEKAAHQWGEGRDHQVQASNPETNIAEAYNPLSIEGPDVTSREEKRRSNPYMIVG